MMLKPTLIKYQKLKKLKRKQLKRLKRRNRKKRRKKKQLLQIIIQIVIAATILQVIVLLQVHHLKVEVRALGVSLLYAGLNLKDKMLLLMPLK